MIKPRKILVDTAALARHFGVAAGTIRRWACQDTWPKYGTRRQRLWNLLDAERSHTTRHADDDDLLDH